MAIFSVPENLAFDSYQALQTAIADWLDRSDLTGAAPSMIALAEARIAREITSVALEKSADLTAVDGVVTLPDDFGFAVAVRYNNRRTLPQTTVADALLISNAVEPHAFTQEVGALRLWPTCDATVTLIYRPRLVNLSEANPTNDMLRLHPDLYFFGAMLFAEGYVANDSRAAGFAQLFEAALGQVKGYVTRQGFAGHLQPRLNVFP